MGEVVKFVKPNPFEKHRGKTLCRSGFHKWKLLDKRFDVKSGKLVTAYQCERCGKEKNAAE